MTGQDAKRGRVPAEHLAPAGNDIDVARQWRRLAAVLSVPAPRARVRIVVGALLTVATIVAIGVGVRHWRPIAGDVAVVASPPVAAPLTGDEGARVESPQEAPRELNLADGSHIRLGPGAVMTLARSRPDDVRLVLEQGSAEFDVTHVPGRRFVVAAAQYEVVVVGTRFAVSLSDAQLGKVAAVRVERGAVEVRRPRATPLLFLRGESWSSAASDEQPIPAARPARAPAPDARALFGVGTSARISGKHADAAAAFDRLARQFPGDPRAALAAFELGRIRLDSLRDEEGAAAAFATAVRLARDPVLREDAAARHAEALDRSGALEACRRARQSYLDEYAHGPHVARVSALCAGR